MYAAVASDRAVKCINPNGIVTVFSHSEKGWTPTGGLAAPDGDIWVLEYQGGTKARVKLVTATGIVKSFE